MTDNERFLAFLSSLDDGVSVFTRRISVGDLMPGEVNVAVRRS